MLTKQLADLPAIQIGKHDVQQNQVRFFNADNPAGCQAIFSTQDTEAGLVQGMSEWFQNFRFIFDDQYTPGTFSAIF